MTAVAREWGAPPVGILGTVLGHLQEENWLVRNRLGTYFFFCLFSTTFQHLFRVFIPYFAKKYPLRVHYSKVDVLQLVLIDLVSTTLYYLCLSSQPRFKDDFITAHRLSIHIGLHTVYTAVYLFCMKYVMHSLSPDQVPAQAANVVRIGVKTSMFVWWCMSGEFLTLISTHPLELTSERYWASNICGLAINSLYTWELLFRDLRPVNVIHHAIACMGFTSFLEWANVLEPSRIGVALPMVGSLIETFVCMGSVAYRFMKRGPTLAMLLLGVTIFVLISYNLLAVGYLFIWWGNLNLFSFYYGYVCMPLLVVFTYPAQMNMARVFYSLYKKTIEPTVTVVEKVEKADAKPSNDVRRRA